MEKSVSISARARTLTDSELLDLYEISSDEEQKELAQELYVRLFRRVIGFKQAPQQRVLFTSE